MKRNRIVSASLAVVMATALVAGCSSGGDAASGDTNQPDPSSPANADVQSNVAASGAGDSGEAPSEAAPPPASGSSGSDDSGSDDTDYPTQDITIVVPFAAGGGTDAVGRAVAHSLSKKLGQNVVVVNKTGGSGAVGMQFVHDAQPDGYTLLLYTGEVVTLPLQGIAQFDTFDFTYLATFNVDPGVMVVPKDSPYKDFNDLMDALNANPGKLKYAASVVPDPRALILTKATGVTFNTIPYEGAAPAIKDLLGGEADFGMFGPGEVKEQVEAGNLRPLAVMGDQPFTEYKGIDSVPTMKKFGIDADFATYRGVAGPPGMPKPVVDKLESVLAQVGQDPDFVGFMKKSFLGLRYMDAADTTAFIKHRQSVIGPIIKDQGN